MKGENDVFVSPILSSGCVGGWVCMCVRTGGRLRKAMSSKEEIILPKNRVKTGINAVENTNHCQII